MPKSLVTAENCRPSAGNDRQVRYRRRPVDVAVIVACVAAALCFGVIHTNAIQVCRVTWFNRTGLHSSGAVLNAQLQTTVDCVNYCANNATCAAVEVVATAAAATGPIACWIFVDLWRLQYIDSRSGFNQYIVYNRTCSSQDVSAAACVVQWDNRTNSHSFGASLVPSVFSLIDCLAACVTNASCVAVDVDTNQPPSVTCYMHVTSSSIADVYPANGVNQYRLVNRCSGRADQACSPTWSTYNNTSSNNGVFGGYYQSVAGCLSMCISTTTCLAVDVSAVAEGWLQCWIHSFQRDVDQKTPNVYGTTQYVLMTRCVGQVVTSTTASTSTTTLMTMPTTTMTTPTTSVAMTLRQTPRNTPSTTQSTTTTIAPTTVAAAVRCGISWSCTDNVRSQYGSWTPPSCYTETGCRSCCESDPNCAGIDVDYNYNPPICYLFSSSVLFGITQTAGGVRHCAAVSQACTTTTTTVSPNDGLVEACNAKSWVCDGGKCLNSAARCNNIFNCLDLSDEQNCSSVCSQTNGGVSCANGLCILPYQLCDGVVDCPDFSDEQLCTCKSMSYKCFDGLCIDQLLRCDGTVDCSEGDDEFNCPCSSGQYQCSGAECIDNSLLCDGVQDCPSADDESSSRCASCGSNRFQCAHNRNCIPASQRCDGSFNCADGSDEQNCVQFRVSTAERRKRRDTAPTVVYPDGPTPISVAYKGTSVYYICIDGWTAQWSDVACQKMGFASSANTIFTNTINYDQLLVLNTALSSNNLITALTNSRPCSTSSYKVSINCVLQSCGWRTVGENVDDTFIDSGSASASVSAWPWHVAIYYNGVYQCAGSVVADQWIMTSARCVSRDSLGQAMDVSKLAVRAGSIYLASVDSQIQVSPVITVNVNPDFDGSSWHGDVALVRLTKPLQMTTNVRPICIPPSSSSNTIDLANQYVVCAIPGWTPTRPSISRSIVKENTLRQVRVKPLSGSQCVVGDGAQAATDSTLLCIDQTSLTGNNTIGLGAAVACRDFAGTWSLVAVALGKSDNQRYSTNPLTNVAAYSNWINSVVLPYPGIARD